MNRGENKPLKIGFVLDDSLDAPDGVQQYVLAIGRWLSGKGNEVHYLVSSTVRTDLGNIHCLSKNMAVAFNGNRLRIPLPANSTEVRKLLRDENFDILHIQMPFSPILAGKVISFANQSTGIVGTFHIAPVSRLVSVSSRLLALYSRREIRKFDAVVSVSEVARDFAKQAFGIESEVLPNAVVVDDFRGAPASFRPAAPLKHVVFLGRLVPRKGCMQLLQAVTILEGMEGVPPFLVSICGKGPLDGELKSYVAAHQLSNVVHFEGFISEAAKPSWLASADITVFPSSGGESFGIVLVEAMASGRSAVLGGDNSGYRSVLGTCPENVLYDTAKPEILAKCMFEILTDEPLRQRIAHWQKAAADQYDVENVGSKLLSVYDLALRRRGPVGYYKK